MTQIQYNAMTNDYINQVRVEAYRAGYLRAVEDCEKRIRNSNEDSIHKFHDFIMSRMNRKS